MLHDVTDRLEHEASFAMLADNLPFVVARLGRDRRHLYVNRAITHFTGRLPAECIGKTNEELGTPPELAALWNAPSTRP